MAPGICQKEAAPACVKLVLNVVAFSLQGSSGLDNLLYSADADFSCFADLAVTSPVDYYLEGQGSLMQCVLTPATQYMPMRNEDIAARVHQQVRPFYLACPCFVSLCRAMHVHHDVLCSIASGCMLAIHQCHSFHS